MLWSKRCAGSNRREPPTEEAVTQWATDAKLDLASDTVKQAINHLVRKPTPLMAEIQEGFTQIGEFFKQINQSTSVTPEEFLKQIRAVKPHSGLSLIGAQRLLEAAEVIVENVERPRPPADESLRPPAQRRRLEPPGREN